MAEDQTITTIQQRPPEEQELFDLLAGAHTGTTTLPGGRTFFPGDTVADFTPDQLAAQEMIRQSVGAGGDVSNLVSGAMGAQGIAQDLGALLSDPLSIPGVRDFRNQTIVDSSRQLAEQILPQMDMGSILAGGFGGPKSQIGRALAAERVADQTLKNLGNFDVNLFGNLLSANTAALNRAPAMAALGLLPGQTMSALGGQIQGQEQQEILGERERHEFEQNEPFFLQDAIRATLGQGLIGQSQTTDAGSPGFMELITGGLGALGGLGIFDDLLGGIPGIGGNIPTNFNYF
jgi:hypothetical protein